MPKPSALSLRTLLYAAIFLPLLVMVALGGMKVWDSYNTYENAEAVVFVQQLANAGGELAQALPAEMFAQPDQIEAARARTDKAFDVLAAKYTAFSASGASDPVFADKFQFISENKARWYTFREHVQANGDQLNADTLAEGSALASVPAAAIDFTRRAGAYADDPKIARLIQGYHALMEVSEASMMEMINGPVYLSGAEFNPMQKTFVVTSKNLFSANLSTAFEQLPGSIIKPLVDFTSSEDGLFIAAQRPGLYSLTKLEKTDASAKDKFMSAAFTRYKLLLDAIAKTREYLDAYSASNAANAKDQLLAFGAATIGLALFIIALSMTLAKSITRSLKLIVRRMTGLAEGDTQSTVPQMHRRDEIGEMAKALEYFRQSAIGNERLQREADELRARSEAEHADVQRTAEEDAARKLTQATGGFAGAMKRLASGDLLCEVHEQFSGEFENLRNDFNASVHQLRDALTTVGRLVSEVDSGSGEISDASSDLAKRTEQQAASLEETAAALAEITSNVTATTKRTNDARTVVQLAGTKAGASAMVVNYAIEAMQKIEKSSQQINQIIGVIDEIAFQTNLLALNAGVEAARAGEAGKGFAVVAQEVRELAQRSANAAKEIKQLISNSASAVGEGVRLVNDTGSGLSEIEKLVLEINAHMDAIASAAQEQSSGLSQVNTAINHMDQATQKNAAMVEELNAAGVGLAGESSRLNELLARFELGGQSESLRKTAAVMRQRDVPSQPVKANVRPTAETPRRPSSLGGSAAAEASSWEEF